MNRLTRYEEIVQNGLPKVPHDVRITLDEVRHLFWDPKTGLAPKRGVLRDALTTMRPATYRTAIEGDLDPFGGLVITETLSRGGGFYFTVVEDIAAYVLTNSPTRLRDFATRSENVGLIAEAAKALAHRQGNRRVRATAIALESVTAASAAQASALRELASVLAEAEGDDT